MTRRPKIEITETTPRRPSPVTQAWDEVRAEKVARARRLVESGSNYPSKEVLRSVAELLAKHLRPD